MKMITGDHVDPARAIGAMLGIGIDRPALTGAEIELLDDQRLEAVTVYRRDLDQYEKPQSIDASRYPAYLEA
ncbi:hypothetical protein, partial [Salmonella sp. M265]|uniref:hypothetical protein n=1 Tax=Salmonella sp. M265 TaxID=3240301 RepID=UPI00352B89D9